MKRYIKVILLSTALLIGLTGCLSLTGETKKDGSSADNLDDEVIISQVKEQLKKNMDQIGFEVNVDDYTYKVYPKGQTGSTSGTVTMRNKMYENYGSNIVYSGSLGSKKRNKTIEFENVEVNPVVIIAGSYQEYIIKNVFNNNELGNNVEGAKQKTNGEILPYSSDYQHMYENQKGEPYNPEQSINQKFTTKTTFLNSTVKINKEVYFNFFKGKKVQNFDYHLLQKEMGYVVDIGLYVDTTDEEITQLQEQIKAYYNKETLVITVTNYKEK